MIQTVALYMMGLTVYFASNVLIKRLNSIIKQAQGNTKK